MCSSRFEKICKLGGEFLQAHISKCAVADLRKSANWEGEFLQAHISKCAVADLRKSANGGGDSACSNLVNLVNKKIKFSKSVFIFYL